jgi:signal transduction histidine kinase
MKTNELKTTSLVPADAELINGVDWFITLRWYAAAGVILFPLAGRALFRVEIHLPVFLLIGTVLFVYNILCALYQKKVADAGTRDIRVFRRFAHFQIFTDWLFLITLVYCSGGIESPLLFFFIFHVILASLLLSRVSCFLHAGFAAFLVSGLAGIEYAGAVPHFRYPALFPEPLYQNPVYVAVVLFFFTLTLVGSTYLATSITTKIRIRDAKLIKLKEDLESAYHDLELADKEKTDFTFRVTHELRGPLSAIHGLLQVILDGYVTDGAKIREYIERIDRRTRTLLDLVTDLLNLAAGHMSVTKDNFACIDAAGVLEQIRALYKQRIDAKGLTFTVEKPEKKISVEMTPSDFELLLTNLIDNAVKYSREGGGITVTLGEDAQMTTIEVKDTGIGIPHADRDRIFQEFYRAENARKIEANGTGLGLSIVKQIATRYNGAVSFESETNNGTTFKIRFPKG